MKNIIILNTQIIKGKYHEGGNKKSKIKNFYFRFLEHRNKGYDMFKMKTRHHKVMPVVIFKTHTKSCYRELPYFIGTIYNAVVKDKHSLSLYIDKYDGSEVIEHEDLKKSFLPFVYKHFNKKQIKEMSKL